MRTNFNQFQNRWIFAWLLVITIALIARFLVYDYGLPFVANVDEPNMYILANDWRGELDAGWRKDWLSGYPPGYPWFSGQVMDTIDAIEQPNIHTDMGIYIRNLRLISLLADTITTIFIMFSAYRLGGHLAAILSGLIWAISAGVILNGISALPDVFSNLFLGITVLGNVMAFQKDSWRWGLVATVGALLSIIFKYSTFPIIFLPALNFLVLLWKYRQKVLFPSAISLAMVLGTMYGLLVAYDADNLENIEARNWRHPERLLRIERWEEAIGGLFNVMGIALLAIIAITIIIVVVRRSQFKIQHSWIIVTLTVLSVLLFIMVPLYATEQNASNPRYTSPVGLLLLVAGTALISQAYLSQKWLKWLSVLIAVLWLLPANLRQTTEMTQVHNYRLAQVWFEENIPDNSQVWTEGYLTNRSLARYEAGYDGFKNFGFLYAPDIISRLDEDEAWNETTTTEFDYIYLSQTDLETYPLIEGFVPLDELTLIKKFEGGDIYGETLYIYSPHPIPNTQETTLTNSETTLMLRGLSVEQQDNHLQIESYWQAPNNAPNLDYSYFIHLTSVDDPTTILAQADGQFGERRTSTWTDTTELLKGGIADFTLPEDLPADEYSIRFGIYYWETFERFVQEDGQDFIELTQITIE